MNRALKNEVADLLSIVGERFQRIAQIMRSDDGEPAPGQPINDRNRAHAVRVLLSLADKTPEEIEILKRLRKGKPNQGDGT